MNQIFVEISLGSQPYANFYVVMDWLLKGGVSFVNPTSRKIHLFVDSDFLPIEEDQLKSMLKSKEPGSLAMWMSDENDIFVSWDSETFTIAFNQIDFELQSKLLNVIHAGYLDSLKFYGDLNDWVIRVEQIYF